MSKIHFVCALLAGLLFAAVASVGATAAEPAPSNTRQTSSEVSVGPIDTGDVVGESFYDADGSIGRELSNDGGVLIFEEVHTFDGASFSDQLAKLSAEESPKFLFSAAEVSTQIQIVPARTLGLEQAGIVVMRVEVTGEYFIASTGEVGSSIAFQAAFADPLRRGYWAIEEVEKGIRFRLIRPSSEVGQEDVAPSLDRAPVDDAGPLETLEVKHQNPDELPSSFPDETWLNPDGSRMFSDEDLREIERSLVPQRERVRTGSTDVIDVAIFDADVTGTWSVIATNAAAIINSANATMINSSQPTRFRLAGIVANGPAFDTPISNAGSSTRTIREAQGLIEPGSPVRALVQTMRTEFEADIVGIIVRPGSLRNASNTPVNGVAGGVPGGPSGAPALSDAIFIVEQDNINQQTAAHEIGHVLGGGHATGNGANTWARSHTVTWLGTSETIMGSAGSSRINRFSSPNQTIAGPGTPAVGTNTRDNLRAVSAYDDETAEWQRGNYCATDNTGHEDFLERLHQRLAGSGAPQASITAWGNRLRQGHFGSTVPFTYDTAEAVEDMGVNGNNFRAYELTRMFRTLLGRNPDFGGYSYWLDRRWLGDSLATVITATFGSMEYSNLHGSKTTSQFVTFLYQNGFGRNPDSGGLTFWTNWIDSYNNANPNAPIGRNIVTEIFINNAEAVNHQVGTTQAVQLYLGLFEQNPNSSGVNTWGNRLRTGSWSQAEVARVFMRYNAYWQTC